MSQSLNFQDLILRLHQFWSQRGCIIWQPYSEKVGAGTMNPATVLSVLGPEPWSVAYAEPSYRPDDGRFGENPNRMQMHTQYQVILKPDPGNPQELYLESLRAIGIDTDLHDIRFVEDNWESPALGAWGLGWEVWLNGLEITQFTYFQQAGSHVLDVPAIEITYGLERIAIFLQGVRKVWDLRWDDRHSYGDILLQPEIDHCHYDFEVANVERLGRLYQIYEEEARDCIAAGLVVPSHDSVLRCSHTFNVLDARGAIGVTERAAYFGKMRELSKLVSALYLKQREDKGFPLLAKMPALPEIVVAPWTDGNSSALGATADFLLEIGVEELPPDEAQSAIDQVRTALAQVLKDLRLNSESLTVEGTPRRVVAQIKALETRQTDREVEVKGPPTQRAYDDKGQPTPTLLGFCKSQGIELDQLKTKEEGGKSYVTATKREQGGQTGAILGPVLAKLISGMKFRKAMRWDRSNFPFSRPLRWVVALMGDQVVPFQIGHVVSDRITRAPRPANSQLIEVKNAEHYFEVMNDQKVVLSVSQRRAEIERQLNATAAAAGNGAKVEIDQGLLDEVNFLVEVPVAVLGRFEEERLSLPSAVLTTVMKKHQRYFPVVGQDGLLPCFVTVSNGQRGDMSLVRQGNEDVLRARYADAQFFVQDDQSKPLESYLERLGTLTFQEKIGSMADKSRRIEQLVSEFAPLFNLEQADQAKALRAAKLCKADLVTSMVIEMTSLQGTIGEFYALKSGESAEVARAIREHYLPRYAGDQCPTTLISQLVGVADRIDSLVSLFSIGLKPTGSADPYGLRRTALGLVAVLIDGQLSLDLHQLFAVAQKVLQLSQSPVDCLQFVSDRLTIWLKDQGLAHDVVEAVVALHSANPFQCFKLAKQLSEATSSDSWSKTLQAYARCKRIVKEAPTGANFDLLKEPSEVALLAALNTVKMPTDITELCTALEGLRPQIDAFFDSVLVNAEEEELKKARQGLVAKVGSLTEGLADFSKLQGF